MPLDVKAAVADALLELIRRKDADKITVKDLVEVCGISRQTFYYHFKDIVDVVEWAAQQGVQRLVRESLNAAPPGGPGRLRGFCRRIPAPGSAAAELPAAGGHRADHGGRHPYIPGGQPAGAAGNARPPGRGLEDCPGFLCLWDDRTAAGELPPAGSGTGRSWADQLFRLLSGEMVRPPET